MPSIDARSEQYSNEFSEKVIEILQDDVISILLYGSGAGNFFEPGESDINLLVVLNQINFNKLRELSSATKKYRLGGVEPLYMTLSEFRQFPVHFPLEAANIRDTHFVLYGEDLGSQLKVSNHEIQDQLIRELFAKTMRCRYLYDEFGEDKKKMLEVFSELTSPYKVMMRSILHLIDEQSAPPSEFLELITQIEERHGIMLEGFREISQVNSGTKRLFGDEHRALMERIIYESTKMTEFASEMLSPRV